VLYNVVMARMHSLTVPSILTNPFIGFSAGGTDLLFENNHIVNGDDCLTVSNGAKNIHFRYASSATIHGNERGQRPSSNSYCANGHGLSIGSLGKGGQVADVENIL
jgi:hypothetical protein